MSGFSTPALLLRRIDHGDYDRIVTFLTRDKGKVSVVAKNAKKSRKRFSGLLEPFTALNVVCRSTRGGTMPILQEASMAEPFANIRADVHKTFYASYWSELLHGWMEEYKPQPRVYRLLYYAFGALDRDLSRPAEMSIIFQMRFLTIAGFAPELETCGVCRTKLDRIAAHTVIFDLEKGGIVCNGCAADKTRTRLRISKGTIKQLAWIRENDIQAVQRLRFTDTALREGLAALESFVPYHLGRVPRSLRVIARMRGSY